MWTEEVVRFQQREVPVFIHVAAVKEDQTPFTCRGYGYRSDREEGVIRTYVLKSQWLRLNEYAELLRELAVLLTSGVDNESYQFKGRFRNAGPLDAEDAVALAEQLRRVSKYAPGLLPLIRVMPSDCYALEIGIHSVYTQTPGPDAGRPVMEGGKGHDPAR